MDPVRNMARLVVTSMATGRPTATPVRRQLRPLRATRSSSRFFIGSTRTLAPDHGTNRRSKNVKAFSRHPRLARNFLDPKLIHANEGSWILGFEAIPKIKIDHGAVFRKLPAVTPQDIRR